jgi:hypothetical protein
MVRSGNDPQPLAADHLRMNAANVLVAEKASDIRYAFAYVANHILLSADPNGELDIGAVQRKTRELFLESEIGQRALAGQHEPLARGLTDADRIGPQVVGFREKLTRVLAHALSEIGEYGSPPALPLEHAAADLPLETENMRADRRLRDVQLGGGAGETARICHRDEDLESAKGHVHSRNI